jgi:protein TonB
MTAPRDVAAGTYALGGAPLIALTQDPKLFGTLQAVSDAAHPVRAVGSEIDFAAALMTHQAGVAVLDSAAVATPIGKLTARLHTQFPDLVMIVAGTAEEQGLLAAQITEGSVHRFLHKPVSEQRVRLFVEAAWRRHEDGLKGAAAAPVARPPQRNRWGLIAGGVLALAAALAWVATHTPTSAPPARASDAAPRGGADDAELEQLLARADQALAAGALTAPPGASAAELYRAALQRNARDPRALNGLEQVIDHLVTDAEAQLQEHHLDAAQQLADQARAINPHHVRVAFLTAQIGAQRERLVLGRAQRAAAGGDVSAALAVLDDAARGGNRSTLVDEARAQLTQKQTEARVADSLARAREALAAGAIIEPAEQNARFYIESAKALAPNEPDVQELRTALLARLQSESRQAAAAGNAELADHWADAAAESGADPADVAALHQAAQQLRGAAQESSRSRSEALFRQRLAQGQLLEPVSDSAKYYLEQLAQAEPAGAATIAARTAFETRLLDEAQAAARAQDSAGARRWLAEAQAAGAAAPAIAAVEAELSAAPPSTSGAMPPAAAGAEGAYVSATTLTRTRYVPPQFPTSAREKGMEGWVDVQFLVNADGTVSEPAIVGAQPVGIFEQSALEAVRRWRYQPVLHDGAPVTQRARVRVRFAVQP